MDKETRVVLLMNKKKEASFIHQKQTAAESFRRPLSALQAPAMGNGQAYYRG